MRLNRNEWSVKRGVWEPKLTEEHVLVEIVERLWLQARIKVWRIRERIPGMSKNLSTPGLPDLMGWIPKAIHKTTFSIDAVTTMHYPLPLFIEVKRPGGVHRPAQIRFIDEAKSDGCVAFFAESWQDCINEFKKIGIELK